MKTLALIACCISAACFAAVSADSSRKLWNPYAISVSTGPTYGNYFNGYDYTLFLAHTRGGMPFRTDWDAYQSYDSRRYFRIGSVSMDFRHGRKPIEAAIGMQIMLKRDSMFYSSTFTTNDTIYGRAGDEASWFAGLNGGLYRYFYVGTDWLKVRIGIRMGLSYGGLGGKMHYYETRYDLRSDSGYISIERVPASAGRWEAALMGSLEMIAEPGSHTVLGLTLLSGAGVHWVPGSVYRGISRNGLWLTVGYRF